MKTTNNYDWFNLPGSTIAENRDYHGVRIGKNYSLYILADGSSSCKNGGKLARNLISLISEIIHDDIFHLTESFLIDIIKQIHHQLRQKFPSDSASFILTIIYPNGEALVLHAGDCLLGKIENDFTIKWLVSPHTLVNAVSKISIKEIACDPDRNYLTRSFRGKKFKEPEFNKIHLSPEDNLLLASDGFWADLSEDDQKRLLNGKIPHNPHDDISYLLIREAVSSKARTGKKLGKKTAETKTSKCF